MAMRHMKRPQSVRVIVTADTALKLPDDLAARLVRDGVAEYEDAAPVAPVVDTEQEQEADNGEHD